MKTFSCPDTVKVPDFDDALNDEGRYDMAKDDARNEQFFADLKAELLRMGYTGKLTGELVYFPMGDGKAIYMVADAPRKTCLIHCPLGDAWSLPDWQTKGLTKADITAMVKSEREFRKLFKGSAK